MGLDLEADGAHPERILDALLAVHDEAARQNVKHFAVGRDRDGASDFGGAVDVLTRHLAVMAADRDSTSRVLALDVLAADADEGTVDLISGGSFRVLDGAAYRPDRLLDVDDHTLLETGRRNDALADDGQAAVAPHLTDERADLARTNIDSDEYRFAFHSLHPRSTGSVRLLSLTDPAAFDRGTWNGTIRPLPSLRNVRVDSIVCDVGDEPHPRHMGLAAVEQQGLQIADLHRDDGVLAECLGVEAELGYPAVGA